MRKIELIEKFSPRSYQQSIFANSIDRNTLVVLPTGLGKTVVAIMLCVYYFNRNNKKILFLAPTKPLVEQQEKSFKSFFSNFDDFNFKVLTGLVSPKKREDFYKESDFIFSTPQLIENDIVNKIIDINDFGLVIIDEAHRGTGNYAYCFIAEEFDKSQARILALTASPGTGVDEIRQVMENLRIEHIEVKKYSDSDVKPYVNKTKIDHVEVELEEGQEKVKNLLKGVFNERIGKLKRLGCLEGKTSLNVTKKDLLMLQSELRQLIATGDADEDIWASISLAAGLMKLQYGMELYESQEFSAAYNYFSNFFRNGGDSSKAVQELVGDIDFRDAFDKLLDMKKKEVLHPKLIKLKEIVFDEFSKSPDLRIIIFNQYRDSAMKIVEELSKVKEIRPVLFVGQAKKGEYKLSQKEQKEVLDKFRSGDFNVLVSTSVGEEGLDIPKVDLVIFYEPVPSAIRTIQRVGRTGRFNEGRAYILKTRGTRDIVTSFVADAKERKMYKALDKIRDDLDKFYGERDDGKNKNLGNYFGKEKESEEEEEVKSSKVVLEDDKILIYVDNRENTDLIKELYRVEELEVSAKKLEVGDIVISEKIAIERKAKIDFVNSIIDKRLFPQLIDLAKNFRRPVLILEGEENIFSLRNLNPNVIRATLSAIAVDLRIPIIYTNNMKDTAQMVLTIAKRTVKAKKDISLVSEKTSFSSDQEIEKFVSTIPKINVVNAKGLLNHFKSIDSLVKASVKDLEKVQGIGKKRAEFLHEFFRREYNNL